jgi:hypothetical protein
MTIRELQYKIQKAIDTYGIPDDAKLRIVANKGGEMDIRAEYGCGFYLLAKNVNGER